MKNLAHFTADEILSIPTDSPERLFSSASGAKQEARSLFNLWHPDRCTDAKASAVFHQVRLLAEVAAHKLEHGTWETPGLKMITSVCGAEFEIRFAKKISVDVGEMYIGRRYLGFEITNDNRDLREEAEKRWSNLRYGSMSMEAEFSVCFPRLQRKIETTSGSFLLLHKEPDQLLLRDVLDYYKGKIPVRHVAWIVSRLLNLACYLEVVGKLAHNAIGPDTVFISPKNHTAQLLGGWWFTTELDQKLKAASPRMMQWAPPDVLQAKKGSARTDMEMIKALGREMLGDVTGMSLTLDSAVPSALSSWLQLSTNQGAVETYQEWQERVLIDAFGERKFVEMNLTHLDLYTN